MSQPRQLTPTGPVNGVQAEQTAQSVANKYGKKLQQSQDVGYQPTSQKQGVNTLKSVDEQLIDEIVEEIFDRDLIDTKMTSQKQGNAQKISCDNAHGVNGNRNVDMNLTANQSYLMSALCAVNEYTLNANQRYLDNVQQTLAQNQARQDQNTVQFQNKMQKHTTLGQQQLQHAQNKVHFQQNGRQECQKYMMRQRQQYTSMNQQYMMNQQYCMQQTVQNRQYVKQQPMQYTHKAQY